MVDPLAEQAEASVHNLFSPDVLLPAQFYGDRTTTQLSGERALQWAVFADGIESYRRLARGRSRAAKRELARLRVWVMRSDWNWLYSFVNLCTTFGFDPNAVRQALTRIEQDREQPLRRRRFRHAA
jgi:hypothetical protein